MRCPKCLATEMDIGCDHTPICTPSEEIVIISYHLRAFVLFRDRVDRNLIFRPRFFCRCNLCGFEFDRMNVRSSNDDTVP